MVTPLAVTKHDDGAGVARLEIAGQLDEDTSEGFVDLIANAVDQDGVNAVVVDLHRVTFLAAAGVRTLLHGLAAASSRNCSFRVVGAQGIVHRVLTISGVLETLAVTPESDSAAI
ncbi:STAS domain-containing protein [Actinoplanes sp. GCM10030250]|uniref:STAS domain-containing protein n=1 Tax=Actinoplanes sp. GCM10030250 TaxID=3273376 RepID=UPI00361FE447